MPRVESASRRRRTASRSIYAPRRAQRHFVARAFGGPVKLDSTGKFPRAARVRRRREFTQIQGEGIRVHTDAFTIVLAPAASRARLGLTVSKRVGNAVVRNRVRRILREIFRRRASTLPKIDLVIIAKPNAATLADHGLTAVMMDVLPAIDAAILRVEKRDKRKGRHE